MKIYECCGEFSLEATDAGECTVLGLLHQHLEAYSHGITRILEGETTFTPDTPPSLSTQYGPEYLELNGNTNCVVRVLRIHRYEPPKAITPPHPCFYCTDGCELCEL